MSKVLITGLALGKDVGACQVCNFDFEWLIRYPSTLIWAEKIIVTETIWNIISSGYIHSDSPELSKAIKLVFEIAKDNNLIEIIDPSQTITPQFKNVIYEQIEKDIGSLAKIFPEHTKIGEEDNVPGHMLLNGFEYCRAYIWSIYAGLALAKSWDAQCLFDTRAYNFCKFKFGLNSYEKESSSSIPTVFKSIFDAYIPNTPIFPNFIFTENDKCNLCNKETECSDSYLSDLEISMKRLLNWRNYDEIEELKSVITSIVSKQRLSNGSLDHDEIIEEFHGVESKLRTRIKLIFPKVQRWANLTTILSIPVALFGLASGTSAFTIAGASVAGLAKITEETTKFFSSKYSWIGFTNKEVEADL